MLSEKQMCEVLSIAAQITSKKAELLSLEEKFQTMIASTRKKSKKPPSTLQPAEPSPGKKPLRSKSKVLRALRNGGEMRLMEVRSSCGLSESTTYSALRALTESGDVIRTGHGKYALKG